MRITCRLEFDAGHRIPYHKSQCQHLHGHRYAVEITLSGDIIATEGAPEQGMVMDFSEVKTIARQNLVEPWDHAFLVYRRDGPVVEFLRSLKGHKTVELECIPTAENLSVEAFRILDAAYRNAYGKKVRLERVRLYETPTCWADAEAADSG
ncbi:MAG: 6-carboxytetrahydropterin synthase QueD [Burkholderiales bacterium]